MLIGRMNAPSLMVFDRATRDLRCRNQLPPRRAWCKTSRPTRGLAYLHPADLVLPPRGVPSRDIRTQPTEGGNDDCPNDAEARSSRHARRPRRDAGYAEKCLGAVRVGRAEA